MKSLNTQVYDAIADLATKHDVLNLAQSRVNRSLLEHKGALKLYNEAQKKFDELVQQVKELTKPNE
jgi:hypothetical protein